MVFMKHDNSYKKYLVKAVYSSRTCLKLLWHIRMCIFFLQLGWVEISLSTHTSVLRKQTANSRIPYSKEGKKFETVLGFLFFQGTIKSSTTMPIKYSWFCPSANVQVDRYMWRCFRIFFTALGSFDQLRIRGWITELIRQGFCLFHLFS